MPISNVIAPAKDDSGNTLVAELLAHKKAYKVAAKKTSEANPFLRYYKHGDGVELSFSESLRAVADDETSPLYIVAKDNPIQSFSLIARKTLPNKLGTLSDRELRSALGTLLDNA